MEKALSLFRRLYEQHQDVELCMVELKRKGFSQMDTIKVLMSVSAMSLVKADEVVRDSLTWNR